MAEPVCRIRSSEVAAALPCQPADIVDMPLSTAEAAESSEPMASVTESPTPADPADVAGARRAVAHLWIGMPTVTLPRHMEHLRESDYRHGGSAGRDLRECEGGSGAATDHRAVAIGPPMARTGMGMVRRFCVVVVVAAGVVLSPVAPVEAEPEPPALGHAERVAGLGPSATGAGYSGDGFAATKARIGFGVKITVAADGAVLLVDSDSQRLRRVGTDGVIDTVPAPAAVSDGGPWFAEDFSPWGVDSGPDGSVYLSNRSKVGRLGKDGSWTAIGGGGSARGDGGPATQAFLHDVENLDVDATGAVYLAEGSSGRVRRIDRDGTITTVAGGGRTAPSADAVPAKSARLDPFDVAVDPAGGFWVVDYDRLSQTKPRLVHVDAVGMLTEVPLAARSTLPFPIAVGADRTVYIGLGSSLYRLAKDGSTTPLGGPFTNSIADIAVGADGTVYTASDGVVERLVRPDRTEGEPRAMRPAADRWAGDEPGTVHRVAGDGEYRESPPSSPESELVPTDPRDVVAAPDGGAYVLDAGNDRVLRVSSTGAVEEFATLPSGQSWTTVGLARGADGMLYTLDVESGQLLRIGPDGKVTGEHSVPVSEHYRPGTLVIDRKSNTYLPSDDGQELLRVAPNGRVTPLATQADLYQPHAAASAPDGSVAVLEDYVHAVRVMRPSGALTTIAGNADTTRQRAGYGGDGGRATAALLNNPLAVAFAPDGAMYIADTMNNRVRKVARNGVITTVAGTGERDETGDDGPATRAALVEPDHLAVADDGALWVTSEASTRVRRIDPDGTITTAVDFAAADADASATPAADLTLDGYAVAVDPKGTVYVDAGDAVRAVSAGTARTVLDTTGTGLSAIVAAADGSLYYGGGSLRRRFPGGADTPVAGSAQSVVPPADGANARTVGIAAIDVAVDPDGTPLIATRDTVFALVGGRLEQRWHLEDLGEGNIVNGIAVGPDRTLYVALAEHEVLAVRDGKARRFAGIGEHTGVDGDGDVGDGGAATDAVLRDPRDVAVTSDGSVFISTDDGIRRINPEGDIDTVVAGQTVQQRSLTLHTSPEALAVDAHDNLYFTEPELNQVRVVVRPAELPDQSGTSLWWWLGGGALVLAAAAAFLWWRRRTSTAETDEQPDEHPDESK
jgi:hypothetical protein